MSSTNSTRQLLIPPTIVYEKNHCVNGYSKYEVVKEKLEERRKDNVLFASSSPLIELNFVFRCVRRSSTAWASSVEGSVVGAWEDCVRWLVRVRGFLEGGEGRSTMVSDVVVRSACGRVDIVVL
jgi:hypothetical protein